MSQPTAEPFSSSISEGVRHGTTTAYVHSKCRCEPCSDAMRDYQKAYRAKHRESILARDREYHRANATERNAERRLRYEASADEARSDARERYQANAESRRSTVARWSTSNPHKRQAYRAARKARKRNAGLFVFTGRDWRRLCIRYSNRCAYCNQSTKLTQDHVVPISRGGTHSAGNIVPACISCNASKGASLLVEWRKIGRKH